MDDVKSIQQPRKKGQKQDSKPTFNMRKVAAINKENGGELISAILFFSNFQTAVTDSNFSTLRISAITAWSPPASIKPAHHHEKVYELKLS